ncbi:hypothetical protein LIER_20203 [Lithospermum erythrorhizon]|uniref:KAT8 regulatory NSL complex subunit 2 n=1 Tax=Lithospermum erythrorhizon TaxID=34254 RepID=A0AAV3QKQ3_LITER
MSGAKTMIMEIPEECLLVSESEHLTRKEVLKRRIHFMKKLKKIYCDRYWLLMEDMKNQFREYYWDYGKSPFVEEEDNNHNASRDCATGVDENGTMTNGSVSGHCPSGRCEVHGCKSKAMALTRFCHMHILSDPKQKLYKPCNYSIKSSTSGPILCGKPILRSTVPSYCTLHLQKAEKHVTKAFKKAGLNVSSTSKLAPKFHVVIAEYVREIQNKRRAALKVQMEKADEKDDISI